MATDDAMQTTAGSWALLGSIVPRDAFIVSQLREAGAIILGHANMSEWASVRSKKYSTGYSPRGGQVRNPYDLSRSPCTYQTSKVSSTAHVRYESCSSSVFRNPPESVWGAHRTPPRAITGTVGCSRREGGARRGSCA